MREYHLIIKHHSKKLLFVLAAFLLMISIFVAVLLLSNKIAAESALKTVYEKTEVVSKSMQYEVQQVKSYAHDLGYSEIKTPGKAGLQRVIYEIKERGDGVILSRDEVKSEVVEQPTAQIEIVGARLPNALTKAKSAHVFVDSSGVAHRETYYDLPMNVVMSACGAGGVYSVREDGAKVDKDGFVIVAANYGNYPRCSVVETSMGPGKVYDTGGFAAVHPHGFDLATDWTKADGV